MVETAIDPVTRTVEQLVGTLGADPVRGLSSTEVAQRQARDGKNVLRAAAVRSAWWRLRALLADPLVVLLTAAAAIAFGAWLVEGRHGWPVDTGVILVVVLFNTGIGWWQQARADQAVAALARLTEASSSVRRDDRVQRIPSAELVVGDLLLLSEGDAVGADARVVGAASLQLLEASLTGESEAVAKDPAVLPGAAALGDRVNMVFKGTAVAQGSGSALVTAIGMQTELGHIATLLDATAEVCTPLQKQIVHLGRTLAVAAAAIAVGVVIVLLLGGASRSTGDVLRALLLGVSLAVAAVPEGLPAILSVVLALGVQRMAKQKAIVKRPASVETLGSATVIATDKTGTLTKAEMTMQRVVTLTGQSRLSGVGYPPEGRLEHDGAELTAGPLFDAVAAVLIGGGIAGNAVLQQAEGGIWTIQGDPTEGALLVAEQKLGSTAARRQRYQRLGEVPFSAERKRMSVLVTDRERGDAPVLFTKGAPGDVLARCTQARLGPDQVPLDAPLRQRILAEVAGLADAALRTLAVAWRPLAEGEPALPNEDLERDLIWLGAVGIVDPPRPEVAAAIREAHAAGLRVVMITGDHPRTALRIGIDLGLATEGQPALTGVEIDALDDTALATRLPSVTVFARVAPHHKLRLVQALQAGGAVVAMTGDGVNDAPALKAADIGIAMGITGTEVSKEAARMILADDNFRTIVQAVREGRGVLDNIRKFLRYLLSSNLGEVLTVFGGVVGASWIGLDTPGIAPAGTMVLPLLATQILWINLITDSGPALAMGVDPVAADTMTRPPGRRGARIVDARMTAGIVGVGVVMALATLLTLDLYLPGGLIAGTASLGEARTAAFTVLVLAQLFNAFNARSGDASAFRGMFANRWLWGAVSLSAALQVAVVHVGGLNTAFGTVPLSAAQWAVCVGMASTVLWGRELVKLVRRCARPSRLPAHGPLQSRAATTAP
ncbi:MAG: cation-translocating P-type ATPase [Planctomycetes bacterium]|jgi:magnesium-transporting ATPase (P-type)|nr:cation-translocating P-type ATPase [Planctomycetota bacterium]